ncbi:asparaginase domain-containing protein [Chthonobacter albigriseus]|uniref:asparaginase domain-containing protein n=1 Tax=Chthonobacter albigriseus TaxID=1683161 RepID=UPI0015EF5595|nr:asparaginase domain-containing protein [Chthonobacter albigriseus]
MTRPKVRIAHVAGPTATIQNTPPLVTSNKARTRHGLDPRPNPDGSPAAFDALRPQRLAAPATVYVEQFSAHPLEKDAADLYGPPDGYIGADGVFSRERMSADDKAVYEVRLDPADGLYPLPYMAVQKDGSPWEEECVAPGSALARQGFFPDGSRSFEEIDRLSVSMDGVANVISSMAEVSFYRGLPPGGFTKGLTAAERADVGDGEIPPERMGHDFFAYKPFHLAQSPPRPALARATNALQAVADSGLYDGIIWTQGSPQIEETAYWFNLLIDTKLPICGNAAQRPQGQLSADGPANIVDSVRYIHSGIWADGNGHNRAGMVVIQEQQFFAAREVMKVDARPGGYVATGGHGGILGQASHTGAVFLMYLPAYKHTYLSDVKLTSLPTSVTAAKVVDGVVTGVTVAVKDADGRLLADAIPSVSITKDGSYTAEEFGDDPGAEGDLLALVAHKLSLGRLGGFVLEGLVPYGSTTSELRQGILHRAIFAGLPSVRVGRGSPEGFADPHPYFIAGSNLTATKARLLLMACLLKFGSLPIAADPANPTEAEKAATRAAVARYQAVFDTH